MRWAFEHVQTEGSAGGSVYLRLSTRPIDQPRRDMTEALADDIVSGAYWLRPPGPNCRTVVAYAGAVAPEAAEAAGWLAQSDRDVALLAITSADRLHSGWLAALSAREQGRAASAHVERLLAVAPRDAGIVTVTDAHPLALGWLGSVRGQRTRALGVEHFGQTGSLKDLYRAYGIDPDAIVSAARGLATMV